MPTDLSTQDAPDSWRSAWPDAVAFVVWLGIAWYSRWTATDLVWSLWLSSLVVGYATIVWTILRPGLQIARVMLSAPPEAITMTDMNTGKKTQLPPVVGYAAVVFFGLFLIGFFTVHFGGFHYVHSQFLISFFPLDGDGARSFAGLTTYVEVFRRYWLVLPAALIAERAGFLPERSQAPADTSVTAEAIARRKLANMSKPMTGMMAPYRNVIRMHMLIFFFFFAHLAKLENFAVYAVVYTVYFFPWRLVRRSGTRTSPAALSA